jgi:hypothetical protein
MFGKYNGFVNKARVSACMYFLVIISELKGTGTITWPPSLKPLMMAVLYYV